MTKLPIWFERAENVAIAAAVTVGFVHLDFSWTYVTRSGVDAMSLSVGLVKSLVGKRWNRLFQGSVDGLIAAAEVRPHEH
jgi:hypothetical protein